MPTSSVSAYGKDRNKLIVVAVGGNALLTERQRGTFEEQMENVEYCSTELCKIIQDGYQLVLTHGNGPQIGLIMLRDSLSRVVRPAMQMCIRDRDIFLEADDGRSIADDIAACIIGNQTASLKICTDFSADSLQGTDVMNEAEGAGCRGTQLQRKGIYKELPLIDGDQLVDVGSLFPKDLFQVERLSLIHISMCIRDRYSLA